MTGLRPALRPALPPSFPASSPQSRQEIRATDAGLMCSCAYKNLGFGRDFALSECSSRRSLSKESKSKLGGIHYDGAIQMAMLSNSVCASGITTLSLSDRI
jgi:hypothetical protein